MSGPVDLDAAREFADSLMMGKDVALVEALVAEVEALRLAVGSDVAYERIRADGYQRALEALREHNEEVREEAHTRSEAEKGWRDAYEALRGDNQRLRAALREVHGHLVGIGTPVAEDRHDIAEARRIVHEAAYGMPER